MFPLVPVCTINCCHKYFSDPYANLEPINLLFSSAFYKSLLIPSHMMSLINSSYSFKQMFKFRNQLYSYYAPLLSTSLQLFRKTAAVDSALWQPISDPLARPNQSRVANNFQSVIDMIVLPNQSVAMLKDHKLENETTTLYTVRVTRTVPTRILRKLLSLILDYDKIPLWDVTLRHCTGMVIKSPEVHNHANCNGPCSATDVKPIKKVDLLHKQIMGNLYMTYARMVYTNSSSNDIFLESAGNGSELNSVVNVNNNTFRNNSIIKASLSNNGIVNAMQSFLKKTEKQSLAVPIQWNNEVRFDEEDEEDDSEDQRAPHKRVKRKTAVQSEAAGPVLADPIYIVQHQIPFHVQGMNNHLIDREVQPYHLNCFGSGFVFEPIEHAPEEVKLTYILQVNRSEWMEEEAQELLDDLAVSRNRSISALISHAYHLSREESSAIVSL
ncbi:hypothetical protein SAMD00019534_105340 [Acytostelium subglobosum LB1]|uniref:hypothetical protein n=1 Tax=Acytostelium subglobosum LB1 TaxID=1410327 RepID=UPI0006448FD4|nr:hypothetical protein SAMD00019534_105340 [Acytostelium subglobosum LB1]GAM27359.1 hypothetical protein SAMD00019534_105340 [Acytostelium subglobosum LB1]|eukprot:XP_012749826.1 hypothetical protein SAMD00019534_105340 [Acytostelium subglobosum LB1]